MSQPSLRTNTSRSRVGVRSASIPHSRSGERIGQTNLAQGSSSSAASFQSSTATLRSKVSRTHMSSTASSAAMASGKAAVGMGAEQRRRPALGDKTNMQNGSQGQPKSNDHTLKHKLPSNTTTKVTNIRASQNTQSVALNAAPVVVKSNSFTGLRHLRETSSSSGSSVSYGVDHDAQQASSTASSISTLTGGAIRRGLHSTRSQATLRRASQQSLRRADLDDAAIVELHRQHQLQRPQEALELRRPSPGVSADEDMSDVESDYQSSSADGPMSSKTETEDEDVVRKVLSSTIASSDEEIEVEEEVIDDEVFDDEEDEDEESDSESLLLKDIDPDCLVSLPFEIDELAREKAAQICQRYEETVLQQAMIRQSVERQEAVSRGELSADVAAHEDELALMGLDPDEVRDTSMVAEYSKEIFEYMSKCECRTMANPNYMDFQGEIRWHMRSTLVDWLMQVHMRYHMMPETLWIAINVVDRFLSARVVSLAKLQLVGVTAMFIAAKYEEILAPSVDEFVFMTENGYTREEILKGERIILSTLDFNISGYCSPYSWVRKISKADDYDIQTRTLAKFLMELTLYDHRFLRAKPSLIAAVAMYLSKKMLGGTWNESFVYYCRFVEEQLVPGANLLLEKLVDDTFMDCFVCKKYGNRKFLKASHFARDWALRNQEQLLVASASASSNISAMAMGMQNEASDMQSDILARPSSSAPAAAAVY